MLGANMNDMKTSTFAVIVLSILALPASLAAQTLAGMNGVQWLDQLERDRKAKDPSVWVQAEVQKIDQKLQQATVKHGPISRVNMPAMTMTFPVQDPAHLRLMKVGEQIEFRAKNEKGVVSISEVRMPH
jgi:Cu(I)/Ag(I) efflux system periplasmic protein CusF